MEYQVCATNLPSDPFVRAYLEAAEWAGICDDSDAPTPAWREQRTRLNDCYNPRWTRKSLRAAREDCEAFQRDNAADLEGLDLARAGHDFYLTRNRHGAGFWDGDYPEDIGKRLTDSSKRFGECWVDFYRGFLRLT